MKAFSVELHWDLAEDWIKLDLNNTDKLASEGIKLCNEKNA